MMGTKLTERQTSALDALDDAIERLIGVWELWKFPEGIELQLFDAACGVLEVIVTWPIELQTPEDDYFSRVEELSELSTRLIRSVGVWSVVYHTRDALQASRVAGMQKISRDVALRSRVSPDRLGKLKVGALHVVGDDRVTDKPVLPNEILDDFKRLQRSLKSWKAPWAPSVGTYEIICLLAEGKSPQEISQQTGKSIGLVYEIRKSWRSGRYKMPEAT